MKFSDYHKRVESQEKEKQKHIIYNLNSRKDKLSDIDIWRIAQDIKKHPEDYKEIFSLLVVEKCDDSLVPYIIKGRESYLTAHNFKDTDVIYIKYGKRNNATYKKLTFAEIKLITKRIYNHSHWSQRDELYEFLKFLNYHIPISVIEQVTWYLENDSALKKNPKFNLEDDDMIYLFKYYDITVPKIYAFLIDHVYNLPKHPSKIAKEYIELPKDILVELYTLSYSPQTIAERSSRNINDEFRGSIRIMDNETDSSYIPTKKEAHNWLLYIVDHKPNRNHTGIKSYYIPVNFPTYILEHTINNSTNFKELSSTLTSVKELSIQTFKVFRWFIGNLASKYFTKKQVIHGPAGQTLEIQPLQYITRIEDEDIPNLKASPATVYENAARREADKFNKDNADKQFNYKKEYKPVPGVVVLQNYKALEAEGKRMNHCVGGYTQSCLNQKSLILALPNSTAELDPESLNIHQHRGHGNAPPSEEDQKLLQKWINTNGGRGLI